MLIELIATFVAGVAGAGIIMLINKGLGGRLPRWLTPIAAGLAMLVATLSNEYGWYGRTSSTLPEGMEIVRVIEKKPGFRVWAYLWPYVDRFAAVDALSVRTHESLPDQRMADLYFYGRWAAIRKVPVLADCKTLRRAQLTEGVSFADDGALQGADWFQAEVDDPILTTICGT